MATEEGRSQVGVPVVVAAAEDGVGHDAGEDTLEPAVCRQVTGEAEDDSHSRFDRGTRQGYAAPAGEAG